MGVGIKFDTISDPQNGKKFLKKNGRTDYSGNVNLLFERCEEESKEGIEHNVLFYKFNQSLCPRKSRQLTC
jgi:hypothetical protein